MPSKLRAGSEAATSVWLALRRLAARRAPRPSASSPAIGAGVPRLLNDADGRLRCTACALCAAACPSACIHIEAGPPPGLAPEDESTSDRRWPARFDLDLGRCLLCGLCQAACPEEAIALMTAVRLPIGTSPTDIRLDREALQTS